MERNRDSAGAEKWWVLAATSGILGLSVLDETIVGVALPRIQADLAMSDVASHWVVNSYLLAFTCLVAIGGYLGDRFGYKRMFLAGAALFALASTLCALSASGSGLMLSRAVQGIAAAIIFPAGLAMITNAFTAQERGKALGIQTTVAAIFMASGPLLGGTLTQLLSWRWIFWVNVPIIVLIVIAVWLAGRTPVRDAGSPEQKTRHRVDLLGGVTLTGGLCALVVAFMQSAEWGWTAPASVALFLLGVGLISWFVKIELRFSDPFIDLDLLRIAEFTGGSLVFFIFQLNKMTTFVFAALFLQSVLKMSPIGAGAIIGCAVLPTLITAPIAGRLADTYGPRMPLLLALIVNGSALCLIAFAMALENEWLIAGLLLIWGATLPFIAVTSRRALMSAVPAEKRGQAGGVNLTIQMFGGTFGIALASAILATSGDYSTVFLTAGLLTAATTLVVLRFIRS